MTKYNKEQFDKIFSQIVVGDMAHTAVQKHEKTWEDLQPIHTTVGSECNNCGKEVDTNAVYYPNHNMMEWTCPHCGEEDSASNWHDYDMKTGNLRHFDTGEEITPKNIHKFFGPPSR